MKIDVSKEELVDERGVITPEGQKLMAKDIDCEKCPVQKLCQDTPKGTYKSCPLWNVIDERIAIELMKQ